MKYSILLICGLLMSCSNANQGELKLAEDRCADKQGVFSITIAWIGSKVYATCRNGDTTGFLYPKSND